MKKKLLLVLIAWMSTSAAEKFELHSLVPDSNSHRLDFASVSVDRIKEKQKSWEDEFDNQEIKRLLTYLGVALGVGSVSFAVAQPYIWPVAEKKALEDSARQNQSNNDVVEAFIRAQTNDYNKKKEERTFIGMLKKNGKTAAALALSSAAMSFFGYLFSSSGKYLKTKLKRSFGFGESEVFAGLVAEVLYSGEQLARSFTSFINVCEEDIKNNKKSLRLRSSLCCGIGIDHYAFVSALEQWAAFIFEFLNQKNMTNDKKKEVFNALVTLLNFFEELVQCEAGVYSFYMTDAVQDNEHKCEDFVELLISFCNEVCRLSQRVGTFYYGTDFTLKNLKQC